MSPNIKRYAPWLGLALVVVVGAYFVAGKRLTGEAGFADENISQLGELDTDTMSKLDKILQIPSLPHVEGDARSKVVPLLEEIRKPGIKSLASVVSHFRDNGCTQPGSALEVDIIDALLRDPSVTSMQRRVVAFILIDAASGATEDIGTEVAQPFAARPNLFKTVGQLKEGGQFTGDLPAPGELKPDSASIPWECAMRSLATAAAILKTGVIDGTALYRQALATLQALPKDHPTAPAFTHVAMLAASASKQPAAEIVDIVADGKLGDAARAVACRAAVQLKVPVVDLKKVLGSKPSTPLHACLVKAGDKESTEVALKSDDPELRMYALRHYEIDASTISTRLAATYEGEMSPRERFYWLDAIARTVVASDKPEDLLKPVEGLHAKYPKIGVTQELAHALLRHNNNRPTLQAAEADADDDAAEPVGDTQPASDQPAEAGEEGGATAPAGDQPAEAGDEGGATDGDTQPAGAQPAQAGDQDGVGEATEGVEGGALVAALADLAQGTGQVTVPAVIRTQEIDSGKALRRVVTNDAGASTCDIMINPGVAQQVIDEAILKVPGGTVCANPGTYTGPLVIKQSRVKLLALHDDVVLDGPIVLEAPVSFVGFRIKGPLVIGDSAKGTILIGNAFDVGGVSETDQIKAIGNTISEGKMLRVPGGHLSLDTDALPGAWRFAKVAWAQTEAIKLELDPIWPPRVD